MIRAVFVGLLAALVLAPLPFASNRPWSWSVLSFVAGVLLVLWAVAALRDRAVVAVALRRVWPFVLCFAAIVGWIVVQAGAWTPAQWHHPAWAAASAALGEPLDGAISVDPEMTSVALMRLLAYAGVFWLALQLGRDEKRARTLLWTLACAGFAYAVYGLVIAFAGYNTILWYERWAYADSLTSTFVNRNSFATYAGLTLVVVLGLLFDEIRRGAGSNLMSRPGIRWLLEHLPGRLGLLLLMATTLGSALLLTGSRGGMASFMVGLAVLSLGFAAFPGNRPLIGYVIVAIVAVFVAGILALSGDVVLARFDRAVEDAVGRTGVYGVVLDAVVADPWVGTGYGTFEVAFQSVRDASISTPFVYDKAHNSYLEFAFEAGVPAFAVMMGLLGGLAALCAHGIWKHREGRLYPCIGLAAAALVAAHALVDFGIQMPAVAVTFAALLGVASAQSLRHRHIPLGV